MLTNFCNKQMPPDPYFLKIVTTGVRCVTLNVRVGGMYWPKTGTTR